MIRAVIVACRNPDIDEYLNSNKEIYGWTYIYSTYEIYFQDWVCDYRAEQIVNLIKECILED